MTNSSVSGLPPATIDDCTVIDLPRIPRRQGNITAIETGTHIPFEVARVYYLYDIPGGEARGGHGHRELQQLIVAAVGSFDVIVDDGSRRKTISVNRAYYGIYVPPLMWRELVNFSSGAICLVLASLPYDENDYFRTYQEFVGFRRSLIGGGA
ncbi:MAG TPA: FdtA/QdtA family cupin domain-containing protein [Thermoanaerobaculia bacterium]|nr:FdtA/QdtA family cupin domain-containing protein [Thermoanaerobaculia bacterium]